MADWWKRWRRNSRIYQIFRLYKYRHWRRSYAQHGEDMVIQTLFEHHDPGFYVDVGCFHPKKYSNTYGLYRMGWHGINIDTSPRKLALFGHLRPRDENLLAAVSDREGEVVLYSFGQESALDTVDAETARRWRERFGRQWTTRRIPARPLQGLLEESASFGGVIDLLSVDVEGHELAVLRGLDFARNPPELIVIEVHAGNLEGILASPVTAYLRERGYRMVSWTLLSVFFLRGPAAS